MHKTHPDLERRKAALETAKQRLGHLTPGTLVELSYSDSTVNTVIYYGLLQDVYGSTCAVIRHAGDDMLDAVHFSQINVGD